jgi:hypothetical protein
MLAKTPEKRMVTAGEAGYEAGAVHLRPKRLTRPGVNCSCTRSNSDLTLIEKGSAREHDNRFR